MIWPFGEKENNPGMTGPARSRARAPESARTWRMLPVEPALTCNLASVMCPWRGESGRMDQRVWAAVRPWLHEAEMVDFTGGGEPMLKPRLHRWIRDAACRRGLPGLPLPVSCLTAEVGKQHSNFRGLMS